MNCWRFFQSNTRFARCRNIFLFLAAAAVIGLIAIDFESISGGRTTVRSDDPSSSVASSLLSDSMDRDEADTEAPRFCPQDREAEYLEGEAALSLELELLRDGYKRLAQVPAYNATFSKQERIDGELLERQVIHFKLRHQPFSVYMKWLEGNKGRELLYVKGRHDDKSLLHMEGWKARLLPILKLDPNGTLAMRRSRYPVTKFGLLELTQTLIEDRRRDLKENRDVHCRMVNNKNCHQRPCYYFVLEYASPEASKVYRKSAVYIDKDWLLPIYIRNYTWPSDPSDFGSSELDQETLIEEYSYKDIQLNAPLTDYDFDVANEDYKFQRK